MNVSSMFVLSCLDVVACGVTDVEGTCILDTKYC
jgi:hypothetical protein